MSSLRITLVVLGASAAAALGGVGCAAESAGVDREIAADVGAPGEDHAKLESSVAPGDPGQSVGSTGDEPVGESQSRQRRYGGGGGYGGGSECEWLEDGTYCGGNRVSGDPDSLYQCSNGRKYFLQYCGSYGPVYGGRRYGGGGYGGGGGGGGGSCARMPPGIPDYCR